MATISGSENMKLSRLVTQAVSDSSTRLVLDFLEEFQNSRLGVISLDPAQKLAPVIGAGPNAVSLGVTTFHDGKTRIIAFADPEDFAARFGQKFNSVMIGLQLLDALRECSDFDGILVNSAASVHSFPIGRSDLQMFGERDLPSKEVGNSLLTFWQRIRGLFSRQSPAKKLEMIAVPPDHKVMVLRPSDKPFVTRSESGVWLASIPSPSLVALVTRAVLELETKASREWVVWVISLSGFEPLDVQDQIVTLLSSAVSETAGRLTHTAVIPYARSRHYPMMKRLSAAGFGVHTSHEDGACFIEVHKPNGIAVGMAGKAFEA